MGVTIILLSLALGAVTLVANNNKEKVANLVVKSKELLDKIKKV